MISDGAGSRQSSEPLTVGLLNDPRCNSVARARQQRLCLGSTTYATLTGPWLTGVQDLRMEASK
jgi:hypothetical protein